MSIVVFTLEEESKIEFVNNLHLKTDGAVSLVVVQKKPSKTFWQRLQIFFKKNKTPRAIYFALLLLFSISLRKKLKYFRCRTKKPVGDNNWLPAKMEVASVNDDIVHKKLLEISPTLIVVWGSGILKSHIVKTSKQVINLHFGLAPYYRGAVGNQFAVLNNDLERIGATLHHINHEADSGDIIETILPEDTRKPPQELFRLINDKAEERFCDVAIRLYRGEELPKMTQDHSLGKIFLLKEWTPEIRYKVGKRISQWEKEYANSWVEAENYLSSEDQKIS